MSNNSQNPEFVKCNPQAIYEFCSHVHSISSTNLILLDYLKKELPSDMQGYLGDFEKSEQALGELYTLLSEYCDFCINDDDDDLFNVIDDEEVGNDPTPSN